VSWFRRLRFFAKRLPTKLGIAVCFTSLSERWGVVAEFFSCKSFVGREIGAKRFSSCLSCSRIKARSDGFNVVSTGGTESEAAGESAGCGGGMSCHSGEREGNGAQPPTEQTARPKTKIFVRVRIKKNRGSRARY